MQVYAVALAALAAAATAAPNDRRGSPAHLKAKPAQAVLSTASTNALYNLLLDFIEFDSAPKGFLVSSSGKHDFLSKCNYHLKALVPTLDHTETAERLKAAFDHQCELAEEIGEADLSPAKLHEGCLRFAEKLASEKYGWGWNGEEFVKFQDVKYVGVEKLLDVSEGKVKEPASNGLGEEPHGAFITKIVEGSMEQKVTYFCEDYYNHAMGKPEASKKPEVVSKLTVASSKTSDKGVGKEQPHSGQKPRKQQQGQQQPQQPQQLQQQFNDIMMRYATTSAEPKGKKLGTDDFPCGKWADGTPVAPPCPDYKKSGPTTLKPFPKESSATAQIVSFALVLLVTSLSLA